MNKKLLIGFAALTLGLVAAFNINLNTQKSELSALSLANVEALASGEGALPQIPCSQAQSNCKTTVQGSDGVLYTIDIEGMQHS